MRCYKCGELIDREDLECLKCGASLDRNIIEQRYKTIVDPKEIIAQMMKGTKDSAFVLGMVLMTLLGLVQLIGLVISGKDGFELYSTSILMIAISLIGLWMGSLNQNEQKLKTVLELTAAYDVYQIILCLICLLTLLLIAIIESVGIMIVLNGVANLDVIGNIIMSIIVFFTALIVIALVSLPIVLIGFLIKKRLQYFGTLKKTIRTAQYNAHRSPTKESYILGLIIIASGIILLLLLPVLSKILNHALENNTPPETLKMLLNSLTKFSILTFVSNLLQGGYIMVSGLWMQRMHKGFVEFKKAKQLPR